MGLHESINFFNLYVGVSTRNKNVQVSTKAACQQGENSGQEEVVLVEQKCFPSSKLQIILCSFIYDFLFAYNPQCFVQWLRFTTKNP